jgi:streptomycin 6-kinase
VPKRCSFMALGPMGGERVDDLTMPVNLAAAAAREGREAWLDTLPATVRDLERRWRVAVGEPFQPGGATAWVAPVTDIDGEESVLKLLWPHPEAAHEADGLRLWAGQGAVLLHAVEDLDHTVALLLERCRPGTALSSEPEPDQDVVIGGLLRRLWVEPTTDHRLRPLEAMCKQWADDFEAKAATGRSRLDPGLARAGIELFRLLPTDAERTVVLCTDLHAQNVLAAHREPWLIIDPKPHVGDPTYDVLQHILNCPDRLQSDPIGLSRRMADLAGLDPERTLLWLFARCVQESPDWPVLAQVANQIAPT